MSEEIIQQLTPEEASELAIIEARIQLNEDAALEYVTDLREIKEKRLYRGTHTTFEFYCQDRWGKTSSAIRRNIDALTVKEQLLEKCASSRDDDRAAIQAFASKASENSLLELSKIKQSNHVDVVVAAAKEAKGKDITAKLIQKTKAKIDHKAIKPPEPEKRRDAWESTYGTGLTAKPIEIKGKRVTLEDFRLMMVPQGLNVPNSAVLHLLVNGTLTKVTSVNFNRNDNELVLS